MNVQCAFLEKSATMAMDFRLFTHNEEVFMNIRQSFNRALLGAVCGALLLVSPASAAEKKIVMRYSHSSSAMVKEPHHAAALDFKNYVEKATMAARSGVFRTSSRGSFRSRLSRSTT